MDKCLSFDINGEEFNFDFRRCIYWPRRKLLLAADLHWGKTQYLRNYGIAVSDKVLEADLERLGQVLNDYEVSSLIILGDLVHHENSLGPDIVNKISDFRDQFPCELILIKGNHDRYVQFPPEWGVVEEDDMILDSFLLTHEPQKRSELFQFAGHIHPMFHLISGHDRLRLPSFIMTKSYCLLPAFSHLTSGRSIRLERGQRALVLTQEGVEVFEKGPPLGGPGV